MFNDWKCTLDFGVTIWFVLQYNDWPPGEKMAISWIWGRNKCMFQRCLHSNEFPCSLGLHNKSRMFKQVIIYIGHLIKTGCTEPNLIFLPWHYSLCILNANDVLFCLPMFFLSPINLIILCWGGVGRCIIKPHLCASSHSGSGYAAGSAMIRVASSR